MLGTCKLCLRKSQDLQESHYIPAALYPRKIKLEYLSRDGLKPLSEDIKAPLLCFDCEQRFSKNGESEVLRHVAGKIANKPGPLAELLTAATPKKADESLKEYNGAELDLNMDMFAYFMLSIAWRGTHSWPVVGGSDTKPLCLGEYEEPIREFLAGETKDFPKHVSVIVIVCTDKVSREAWFLPTDYDEDRCRNVAFLAFGVHFRLMMGMQMNALFREASCHSSGKWISLGNCERRTNETLKEFLV